MPTLTPGRPLLSTHSRRRVGWLAVACAIFVVAGGVLVAGQTHPDPFDNAVDSPIIARFGDHAGVLLFLAAPGTRLPVFVVTAVLAVACLLARRLNGAILAVLAIALSTGLDDYVLKPLFDRRYFGSLVYPSGHTTAVVTFAATLTVLLASAAGSGRWRWPARLVLVLAWADTIVVATSVIALRWHYFSDTLAGAAVAIAVVCGLALALDQPRLRSPQTGE